MHVSAKRVGVLLNSSGFVRGEPTPAHFSSTYFRRSAFLPLYESVIVDGQGKHGEAVYASVGVSVTRRVMYKMLGTVQPLLELAEDSDRGWTIVRDSAKARDWELRLSMIADVRASNWTRTAGPDVLRQTDEVRSIVVQYLAFADNRLGNGETGHRVTEDDAIEHEVGRFSQFLPSSVNEKGQSAYLTAYKNILRHSQKVEAKNFFGKNPVACLEFADRIHVLADRLLDST